MTETEEITETARVVGRNIALARKLLGMNQAQLAELAGVPRNYLSDWEKGRHEPRPATRERLAQALEQPVWWFYYDHTLDDEPKAAA